MAKLNTHAFYLPEKYKIITGHDTNVALCTVWTDPDLLLKKDIEILQQFSIIGTLYSREGVSIIVRNLCLNPHIDTVLVWSASPLSDTAIGKAGKTLLLNLWKHGIDEDHQVRTTSEKIHSELDPEVLQNVLEKVTVIELSTKDFSEMITEAKKYTKKSKSEYKSPISFPEPKRSEVSQLPSEHVGISVRGTTLTQSWLKAADKIIRYGALKKTESSSNQKELQHLTWTIENETIESFTLPEWPEHIKKHIGLDSEILTQYKDIFIDPKKPEQTAYTYGNRLNDYLGKTDQIELIIEKLKESDVTRRAYASTFYPPEDLKNPSPPCLTQIQFLIGEKKQLNVFANFRSHDIAKAAIPNAYGLLHLQNYVGKKAELKPGSLTITSVSAHIYEEDWQIVTDTLKCALWERTKLYFDENEDIDPRGIVRIQVIEHHIHIELMSLAGEVLWEYSAKSAREGVLKIARLDLLSRSEHYADVSIELVKAEICMKQKREYIQDKPLILDGVVIK